MTFNITTHTLRSLLIVAIASLSLSTSFAQSAAATPYAAENEGWLVSLDEAYALHQKTGKPILANFTGSDWCGWCKRLTSSVFVKDDFKTWADKNVILLELDFPRRKKLPQNIQQQNAGLQRAFGVRGYPSIWVFDLGKDAEGQYSIEALGKTGYRKTVGEFVGDVDAMIAKRDKAGS